MRHITSEMESIGVHAPNYPTVELSRDCLQITIALTTDPIAAGTCRGKGAATSTPELHWSSRRVRNTGVVYPQCLPRSFPFKENFRVNAGKIFRSHRRMTGCQDIGGSEEEEKEYSYHY